MQLIDSEQFSGLKYFKYRIFLNYIYNLNSYDFKHKLYDILWTIILTIFSSNSRVNNNDYSVQWHNHVIENST